jgi:hypothetical protein
LALSPSSHGIILATQRRNEMETQKKLEPGGKKREGVEIQKEGKKGDEEIVGVTSSEFLNLLHP